MLFRARQTQNSQFKIPVANEIMYVSHTTYRNSDAYHESELIIFFLLFSSLTYIKDLYILFIVQQWHLKKHVYQTMKSVILQTCDQYILEMRLGLFPVIPEVQSFLSLKLLTGIFIIIVAIFLTLVSSSKWLRKNRTIFLSVHRPISP